MKIAVVPLDDRPCCAQWPGLLADLAGWTVVTPERALLGQFTTPGDSPGILHWVRATPCDARLVSLDMLTSGGLVAGRSPAPAPAPSPEAIRQVLAAGPPCFANNVLMRVAPTATREADAALTGRLHEFSRRKALGESVQPLLKGFPPGYLDTYLHSRERNHALNCTWLQAAAAGDFEFLVLGIDDSKTMGLNVVERQALEPLLSERSAICPGTDELSHLLLARMTDRPWRVHVTWSHPDARRATPLYEDRSFEALITAQFAVAGARQVASQDEADICLYAHIHPQGQKEAAEQLGLGRAQKRLAAFVESIATAVSSGRSVAIADMAYANGGDLSLASMLQRQVSLVTLDAYSAWNTAGNSLGTALAAAILRRVGKSGTPSAARQAAHVRFMLNRWLDDVVYQARIRQQARLTMLPLGVSAYSLGEHWRPVESKVAARMRDEAQKLFSQCFAGQKIGAYTVQSDFSLQARLPWPRLFEIELDCEVTVA